VKALAGFAAMLEKLIERSHELDMVALFDLVVESSGYKQYITGLIDGEERWENVQELRGVAQDYKDMKPGEGLTALLEGVALVSDVDDLPEKQETVTLITLHQAKGLEFPVVFIVGMEDGIIPHYKSIDDPAQLEEERRLCYVGITRAKKKVYLVRAFRRHLMGSSAVNKPSRFLLDIPEHLLARSNSLAAEDEWSTPTIQGQEEKAKRSAELPEFKPGDHVRHDQFGEGVVVNYHRVKNDAEVVVAFDGVGVKRFLLSFAKIEKV
jgi:DNA helicase-2/ATP-dependent DNA helicase PcrA